MKPSQRRDAYLKAVGVPVNQDHRLEALGRQFAPVMPKLVSEVHKAEVTQTQGHDAA